jgi:protein disulfide-isomerase A6
MRSQISTLASLLSLFTVISASNVIDLTPSNFDDIIGSGKPALVIPSPHRTHNRLNSSLHGVVTGRIPVYVRNISKTLAPVYEQLADAYTHAKEKVIVAKVDADAHRELGQRFGVTGFPTLKVLSPSLSVRRGWC